MRTLRLRLVAAGVADRRSIERALHDGVQQDLVAISVRLQLLRELMRSASADALEVLDDIRRDARAALDDVRTLAATIYPAALDTRGLSEALGALARASPVDLRVDAAGVGRYPGEIEAAVYFTCRALLDGLDPGAEAAIRIWEEEGALNLEVVGGRAADLVAVKDLVEGTGGTMTVEGSTRLGARFELVSQPPSER